MYAASCYMSLLGWFAVSHPQFRSSLLDGSWFIQWFFPEKLELNYAYIHIMICSFLYKLEGIVSIKFIPTNHQETFKVTTGAPPPGVSTLEGQNWKLQFPEMKLVLERWNGAFGKPCLGKWPPVTFTDSL